MCWKRYWTVCVPLLFTVPIIASGQANDSTALHDATALDAHRVTFGAAGGTTLLFHHDLAHSGVGPAIMGVLGFHPSSLPFEFRLLVERDGLGTTRDCADLAPGACGQLFGGSKVFIDTNGTVTGISASVLYAIPRRGMPYLTGGAGFVDVDMTATADTNGNSKTKVSLSRKTLGLHCGLGWSRPLFGTVNTFIEMRYHYINGGHSFLPVVVGVEF